MDQNLQEDLRRLNDALAARKRPPRPTILSQEQIDAAKAAGEAAAAQAAAAKQEQLEARRVALIKTNEDLQRYLAKRLPGIQSTR